MSPSPRPRAYVALGANLGDRYAQLCRAFAELERSWPVIARSPIYETAPAGLLDQPAFLNAVVSFESAELPEAVLDRLLEIEAQLGRRRADRNGPRDIDLDLLVHGAARLLTPGLTLPHPRMTRRRFVLRPLADIAPELTPPGMADTVAALLRSAKDGPVLKVWPEPLRALCGD